LGKTSDIVIELPDKDTFAVSFRPTAISLFAGAGGCSLGFGQAGYDVRFATDIDADSVESYRRNFPGIPCDVADIRQLTAEAVLQRIGLNPGELDMLLGGPPCQGFSSAGVKGGDDPRNSLLGHYVRLLEGIRPKWFVMENVEGLLTNDGGSPVRDTVAAFLEAGYSLNLEKVYAQGYGIPQRRKRVLIVGNRLGYDFLFPEPVTRFSGSIFRKGEITFATAVGDLPPAATEAGEPQAFCEPPQNELQAYLRGEARTVTDHYAVVLSEIQLERVRGLQPGQTMKDLPEHLQHDSFRRRAFRRVMDGTPVEKRGGAPSGLKRLFADEPSLTITSAATREFVHPTEDRLLTLRECARLQTFPDSFEFAGSAASRIQQVGNAIPPMLARAVAEHIARNYGFAVRYDGNGHPALRFCLTRSVGMSPALALTESLLAELVSEKDEQFALLEQARK
jgi:DNA (cytosine-5)-methyltransferase 1